MSNENLLWMALASVHSCRFCMYCAKIDNASRDNTITSGQLSPTNGERKFSYEVSGLINSRLKCTFSTLITRDVSAGATGATAVAPKFSDTLTLF